MSAIWLGAIVSLSAFVAVNLVAGGLAWLAWPALSARFASLPPRSRAWASFASKTAPLAAALAAAAFAGLAFLAFEPAGSGERAGFSLFALAGAGGALLGAAAARTLVAVIRSRRLVRAWTRAAPAIALEDTDLRAWRVDMAFPLVALTGLWRPGLLVARPVLERCTPAELAAIVSHERAHVAALDNLKRLCLYAAADLFGSLARGREMDRAWQDASEEAADQRALAAGTSRLDLASALVTLARIGAGAPRCPLPAGSTFYRGGGVERRVRRLLAEADPSPHASRGQARPPRRRSFPPAFGLAVIGVMVGAGLQLAGSAPLRALYEMAEWAVQTLP